MKYPTTALLLGTVLTTFVFSDAKDACNLTQYLEFGRRGVVNCGFEEDFILIAWFNSTTDVQPLVEMVDSVKSGRGYDSGEFDIYPNGSLIINEVNFQHDHPFMVWVVDKLGTATSIVIHVVVTVPPNPPYPVVEGCDKDRYCVLEVRREGVVTCSLRGIRPEVQLELTTFQSDFIDFWNKQLVVTEHTNGTYDISLTSDFTINLPPFNRVTVVCRTLSYELSTQFDLLYHIVPPNPPYPVVEGCDNDRYCVLEVGREGALTCSLRGIHPLARLELTTFQSDFIDFWNEQLVVTVHTNGTSDISLTSGFTLNLPLFNRVTVVCRTPDYEMSTQFDLLYHIDPPSTTHDLDDSLSSTTYLRQKPANEKIRSPVLIGTTLVAIILIVTMIGIFFYTARHGSKMENLQNL